MTVVTFALALSGCTALGIGRSQAKEIAEIKMKDLNAVDIAGAVKQIEGTARSMGIDVVG